MKLLLSSLALAGAVFLAPHAAAGGASFDASSSKIKLREGAALSLGFESAESLIGYELATWKPARPLRLERKKIEKTETLEDLMDDDAPLEGARSLYLGGGKAFVVNSPEVFAPLAKGRLEVTLWARALGTAPLIQIVYDGKPEAAFSGYEAFGQITAIRSGRQTNDGWVEYTSGPIDGSFWGVPIQGVIIAASPTGPTDWGFSIDALEVTRLPGEAAASPPNACTQANVSETCGPEGDCTFGHCAPAALSWGPLPPPEHRAEIAERWALWSTRLTGDRNSAKIAATTLVPKARELAKSARSSREFYGGMFALVGLTRDQHTSFGTPINYTIWRPVIEQGVSLYLGACFGVVEKDILGGGLGFAVYSVEDVPPAIGVQLKRGDVLTAIDGKDPKAWLDEFGPQFIQRLPNDPAADPSHYAYFLSSLLVSRASTMTITRCASSTECSGSSRETFTVDVGKEAFDFIDGKKKDAVSKPYFCSPRFSNSVASSEARVWVGTGGAGETRVQFDDFIDVPSWRTAMTDVFSKKPAKVVMDARMGKGGSYPPIEHLFHLLRGTNEPFGVAAIARGTYDLVDPPWLFERTAQCTPPGDFWKCYFSSYAYNLFTKEAEPPGANTKIAWLNAIDVSANDYAARLLKGRSNLRIFAPHPTAGAYGSSGQLPRIIPEFKAGSIQFSDSKFGADNAAAGLARWESGHGVEPDQQVAQKLSDAIANVDTMLKVASEWLADE